MINNYVSPGCFLSFNYNMDGNSSVVQPSKRWEHLSITLLRDGFESTEIWNSDVFNPKYRVWNYGSAIVGRVKNKFSLRYTASDNSPTEGPGTFGYVALTNINMYGCTINMTAQPQSCDTNGQFRCGNGRCISKYYVCDYSDDCGDGSDETYGVCSQYKLRCDFENGMCDWGRYRRDSWKIGEGQTSLKTGPTRDHSKGKFFRK